MSRGVKAGVVPIVVSSVAMYVAALPIVTTGVITTEVLLAKGSTLLNRFLLTVSITRAVTLTVAVDVAELLVPSFRTILTDRAPGVGLSSLELS